MPCFSHITTDGGIKLYIADSVGSTNAVAKQIVRQGGSGDTFALFAKEQTAGRGRYDRSFLSEPDKGAYVSFVRKIEEEYTGALTKISCFSSLAVCGTIKEFGVDGCAVKWPNDVKLNGKKVCGILPETVVCGGARYLVLGVGVNLNYAESDLKELQDKATSLGIHSGKTYDCLAFAAKLADNVAALTDEIIGDFAAGRETTDTEIYKQYLLLLETLGQTVRCGADSEICGIAVGVDGDGSLLVDDGRSVGKISWGEIVTAGEFGSV